MKTLRYLIIRNCKVYFKEKGVFFPSLISPLILLFLFMAFLGNVYRDSIRAVVEGFPISDGLVESIASGWLLSSLLAVCTVTIAVAANTIMVQDKALGQANDLFVTPVHRSLIALSYFISTFLVTTIICLVALVAGFIYIGIAGWHLTAADVFLALADTLLLILFGTAFSSIVSHFLSSQGGIGAVATTISASYGFLCGAYMPLSQLTPWMTKVIMFLPGTYGTGLLHSHLMGSAINAVTKEGMPVEFADGLKKGFDCKLYFFETQVPEWTCYLVLGSATLLLIGIYVLLCCIKKKRSK